LFLLVEAKGYLGLKKFGVKNLGFVAEVTHELLKCLIQ